MCLFVYASQRTSLLSSKVFSWFLSFSWVQTILWQWSAAVCGFTMAMSGWIMRLSIFHDVGSVLFSSRDICCCVNPHSTFLTIKSHHSLVFACSLWSASFLFPAMWWVLVVGDKKRGSDLMGYCWITQINTVLLIALGICILNILPNDLQQHTRRPKLIEEETFYWSYYMLACS